MGAPDHRGRGEGQAGVSEQLTGASIEYDLSAWSDEHRDALAFLAVEAGIPFRWRDATFVTPPGARAAVDAKIAYLVSGGSVGDRRAAPPTNGNGSRGGTQVAIAAPDVERPAAGWYPDPWGQAPWRWWDGNEWTGFAGASAAPSKGWFPPRKVRDAPGMRGGGIAIIGVVSAIALSILFGLLAVALGARRHGVVVLGASELGLWSALVGACLVAVRRHGSGSLRDLGLVKLSWRDTGRGIVAGFAGRVGSLIVVIPLVPLLQHERVSNNTSFDGGYDSRTVTLIALAVITLIGAPIVEELFFRGLVQGALTRRWGPFVAVWVQAALFACAHYQFTMTLGQTLVTVVAIMFAGLLLGVLRWRYGRLGPGMVAHATFNLIALLLAIALT